MKMSTRGFCVQNCNIFNIEFSGFRRISSHKIDFPAFKTFWYLIVIPK